MKRTEVITPRLRCRAPRVADTDPLYELFNDPEVMRFIGSGSLWSKHDVAKRIERGMALFADDRPYFWTIERLDTGEVIGQGGLVEINFDGPEIELGYRLGKAYWGLGFASEIAQAAAHAAFTPRSEGGFGFDRLVAVCIPENEPSRRVLAKAGFTEVGTTDVYYGVTSLLHEHRALNQ